MVSTKPIGAIVGLTGGIATGKSTVANHFIHLHVPVFDADQLAREVVAPGTDGLEAIKARFGAHILTEVGTLDRKALGTIVFQDQKARRDLEGITHPRIAMALREKALFAFAEGHPWVLYDAALLVETGSYKMLQALIVVDVPVEMQRRRLIERDHCSSEEAEARINAQAKRKERLAVADYLIDNSISLRDTHRQVEELKTELDQRFALV